MSTHSGAAMALLGALTLASCGALPFPGGGEGANVLAASAPGSLSPTDVEAPEVFRVAEAGLWDGRPSLGGVWVAHPDARDPERVRIVNQANGQEVIGALFRRERDLPGPALQVSSDAAEALGMLAGAPAELEVIALRRREGAAAEVAPPAEPPAPEEPPVAAAPAPETGAAPADPGRVAAVEAATAAILANAAPAPAPSAIATTTLDAAAAPASGLNFPFVQLGTYEVESFAGEAARALQAEGLPVRVVAADGGGSWRLLLGPATTETEQEALLARAVAEGFADAYLVRR